MKANKCQNLKPFFKINELMNFKTQLNYSSDLISIPKDTNYSSSVRAFEVLESPFRAFLVEKFKCVSQRLRE